MAPINDKKFRFSDAVYVAETTPKSLRKWLQNPDMRLFFSGQGTGWREFNFADLAVLAVMRKLVDFGLTIDTANTFANVIIAGHGTSLFSHNTSPDVLVAKFDGSLALVYLVGKKDWAVRIDPKHKYRPPPAAAYLTLHLHEIMTRVMILAEEVALDPERIEYGNAHHVLKVDGKDTGRK